MNETSATLMAMALLSIAIPSVAISRYNIFYRWNRLPKMVARSHHWHTVIDISVITIYVGTMFILIDIVGLLA